MIDGEQLLQEMVRRWIAGYEDVLHVEFEPETREHGPIIEIRPDNPRAVRLSVHMDGGEVQVYLGDMVIVDEPFAEGDEQARLEALATAGEFVGAALRGTLHEYWSWFFGRVVRARAVVDTGDGRPRSVHYLAGPLGFLPFLPRSRLDYEPFRADPEPGPPATDGGSPGASG